MERNLWDMKFHQPGTSLYSFTSGHDFTEKLKLDKFRLENGLTVTRLPLGQMLWFHTKNVVETRVVFFFKCINMSKVMIIAHLL